MKTFTRERRIEIYKFALMDYTLHGWEDGYYSAFICSRLSTIGRKFTRDEEYLDIDTWFPEVAALNPGRHFKDGTTKWWKEKDVNSRMNALAIAIALAELNIPLP